MHTGIKKVIINTDSLNSISILNNNIKSITKYNLFYGKKYRKMFDKIIRDYSRFYRLEVEFRHVKAHSGKNDKSRFVNEWCDKNAKHYPVAKH